MILKSLDQQKKRTKENKKSHDLFVDKTRSMAVGTGESDNKKAIAKRQRQVCLV